MSARTVVLFDLDRTLVDFGVDAPILDRVILDLTGLAEGGARFDGVGLTERGIAVAAARLAGLPVDEAFERYASLYTPLLRDALATRPREALPGVPALLAALEATEGVSYGLATGGMRVNALLKVAHAGLGRYFDPPRGAFGDTHEARVEVFRAAAQDCGWATGERLVFVGDTPRDMEAALEAGGTPVGVATGAFDEAALRAAGATVTLPSLVETERVLGVLLG
ncbi:MAG: hypothetical protein AMXMBFR23_03640 [Chloroflexota bacterium]